MSRTLPSERDFAQLLLKAQTKGCLVFVKWMKEGCEPPEQHNTWLSLCQELQSTAYFVTAPADGPLANLAHETLLSTELQKQLPVFWVIKDCAIVDYCSNPDDNTLVSMLDYHLQLDGEEEEEQAPDDTNHANHGQPDPNMNMTNMTNMQLPPQFQQQPSH